MNPVDEAKRVIARCIRQGNGHVLNGARRLMLDGAITDAEARFATDYHTALKADDASYAALCAMTREQRAARMSAIAVASGEP